MIRSPVIGVLGASGEVGRAAVRALRDLGHTAPRLGGRNEQTLRAVQDEELAGRGTVLPTDVDDPAGLAAFVGGCDIVLNCVGPTYRLRARVAAAALAVDAHCVDVAGDDPAAEDLLAQPDPALTRRSVVLSAGVLPGLSSILPRWLARHGMDKVSALEAYCGGLEPCSPTVATDLILSLTSGGADGAAYGEPLAAVRGGRRVPRTLRAQQDIELPGFPGRVDVVPFLSDETERLAVSLGLDRVDWYNVHPGRQVHTVLNALPSALAAGEAPQTLEQRLIRAAALDLAGRSPYYLLDFRLSGTVDGQPAERRLTVQARSSYRLTAAVGVMAVDAITRGTVPSGVHFACDVLDPEAVADGLRAGTAADRFALVPSSAEPADADTVEEGAL